MEDGRLSDRQSSKTIKRIQSKRAEGYEASRKYMIEQDRTLGGPRGAVYGMRRSMLEGHIDLLELSMNAMRDVFEHVQSEIRENESYDLGADMREVFGFDAPKELGFDEMREWYRDKFLDIFMTLDTSTLDSMEQATLSLLDEVWVEYMDQVSELKHTIHFRGYGRRDPRIEFKKEAYNMFDKLLSVYNRTVLNGVCAFALPDSSSPDSNVIIDDGYVKEIRENKD